MVTWTQMYMPMGGLGLSALVALIPIIFFFVALAVLRHERTCRWSNNPYIIYPDCNIRL